MSHKRLRKLVLFYGYWKLLLLLVVTSVTLPLTCWLLRFFVVVLLFDIGGVFCFYLSMIHRDDTLLLKLSSSRASAVTRATARAINCVWRNTWEPSFSFSAGSPTVWVQFVYLASNCWALGSARPISWAGLPLLQVLKILIIVAAAEELNWKCCKLWECNPTHRYIYI